MEPWPLVPISREFQVETRKFNIIWLNKGNIFMDKNNMIINYFPIIFSDLPSSDLRLDSFCAYLLKNNEKERVLELCLLEQFSLPGLDAQNDQVTH